MKIQFKSYNPYAVFWVMKVGYIWAFVLIWNILCGVAIYLNGGMGKIEKPGSTAMFGLACLYAACCAFAPLASEKTRKRWCKEGADFEEARYGLWQSGIITAILSLICFGSLI